MTYRRTFSPSQVYLQCEYGDFLILMWEFLLLYFGGLHNRGVECIVGCIIWFSGQEFLYNFLVNLVLGCIARVCPNLISVISIGKLLPSQRFWGSFLALLIWYTMVVSRASVELLVTQKFQILVSFFKKVNCVLYVASWPELLMFVGFCNLWALSKEFCCMQINRGPARSLCQTRVNPVIRAQTTQQCKLNLLIAFCFSKVVNI